MDERVWQQRAEQAEQRIKVLQALLKKAEQDRDAAQTALVKYVWPHD